MSNNIYIHRQHLFRERCRQKIENYNNHRKLDELDVIHGYGVINIENTHEYIPCSDCYTEMIMENYNG